ncbi:hypothetical protein [Mycobacterium sp. E2733]|uniref:hypothetical protein n=1 Tax=Mycobacterium sp. E2733 TaxID=1834138 RepID=UPI0007FCE885|nr:hypothetical protein [Mycobacterium sp. E2733]OBH96920.1 hypothetical protein A5678_25350 [Mycobacterium sp. E2733]
MDPHERIPRDDWADQDLLTKDEAAERLSEEIAEVSGKLNGAHAGDEILERRLNGLKEAYKYLTEGA